MLGRRLLGLGSLQKSAFARINFPKQPLRTPTRRCLATKNNEPRNDANKSVRFRNFIAVGIISWIILAQVVEAVNKEQKGSRSMSESEYFKQQMKLKRRRALFTQDDKQVYFIKNDKDPKSLESLEIDGFEIIDPKQLIEKEKKDEQSLFNALLNDPDTKSIPTGLLVDLISKSLKNCEAKKFIVINYPPDIKESVKFEEKVVTIKKLINISQETDATKDEVLKYYNTVNKVENLENVDDLSKSLE